MGGAKEMVYMENGITKEAFEINIERTVQQLNVLDDKITMSVKNEIEMNLKQLRLEPKKEKHLS